MVTPAISLKPHFEGGRRKATWFLFVRFSLQLKLNFISIVLPTNPTIQIKTETPEHATSRRILDFRKTPILPATTLQIHARNPIIPSLYCRFRKSTFVRIDFIILKYSKSNSSSSSSFIPWCTFWTCRQLHDPMHRMRQRPWFVWPSWHIAWQHDAPSRLERILRHSQRLPSWHVGTSSTRRLWWWSYHSDLPTKYKTKHWIDEIGGGVANVLERRPDATNKPKSHKLVFRTLVLIQRTIWFMLCKPDSACNSADWTMAFRMVAACCFNSATMAGSSKIPHGTWQCPPRKRNTKCNVDSFWML